MVSMTNCTPARDGVRKRLPAVAGSFYPADSAELRETVDGYLAAARTAPVAARAVIAPHAGYVFSGPVAAEAFAALDPAARYERVFLLGPSHCAAFDGISVDTEYSHYLTPLGSVGVDRATGRALQEADSVFRYHPAAHEGEHCLEVELPFLQARLEELPPVVPLIVAAIATVSTLSRSVKEASGYTSVIMILVMVLSVVASFVPGIGNWVVAVPVLNAVAAMQGVLTGAAQVWMCLTAVALNLVYTALLAFLISRLLSSERVMFGT